MNMFHNNLTLWTSDIDVSPLLLLKLVSIAKLRFFTESQTSDLLPHICVSVYRQRRFSTKICYSRRLSSMLENQCLTWNLLLLLLSITQRGNERLFSKTACSQWIYKMLVLRGNGYVGSNICQEALS